jgi:hypothetical protein
MSKSRIPKAKVCYICRRQTLLPGYEIHVSKCKELFIQRESLKPVKERRPCPRDPFETGIQFGSLDEQNDFAHKTWKSSLSSCSKCGRTFLPDKLIVHQRSCNSMNPAKSVLSSSQTRSIIMNENSSQNLKLNSNDNYRDTPEYGHLIKCRECGRNFNPDSYDKSVNITCFRIILSFSIIYCTLDMLAFVGKSSNQSENNMILPNIE